MLELVAQWSEAIKNLPSGAKARCLCAFCGTAEAVPLQNRIYATSSRLCPFDFVQMGVPQGLDFETWESTRPERYLRRKH